MANTSTLITSVNMRGKTVYEYRIVIDTINTDLTIRTAKADHQHFLMGWMQADSTAGNVTFKSGTTTITPFEFAANQGPACGVDRDTYYMASAMGEALVFRSDALLTGMVVHIFEGAEF